MAMVINNNSSAQMALGEMRKNNSKLDQASRQAASGVKIGGAGDGASEYSISEKMRVQIRGLEQDIANAQTGTNLIKTAEGGIQEILNNLRSLKELALNAANDHNSDLDRETIQKEVDSRLATIDDIAATTNYNGRLLLNGNYGMPKEAAAATRNLPTEPTGEATLITGVYNMLRDYTITSDGVYAIADDYHGTITVNAANVKLIPQNTGSTLTSVSIKTSSSGGTNLWLDGISINNASTALSNRLYYGRNCNVVQFQGSNNTLNILDSVRLIAGDYSADDGTRTNRENSAVINIGDGLAINGANSSSELVATLTDTGPGYNCEAAAIGTDRNQRTSGNLSISGLSYLKVYSEDGAGIGAGNNGSIGSITLSDMKTIHLGTRTGAGIGRDSGSCGPIRITAEGLYGGIAGGGGTVIKTNSTVDITADYVFLAGYTSTASVGNYTQGSDGGHTISAGSAVINGETYNSNGHSYLANPNYTNDQVYESYPARDSGGSNGGVELRGLIIHTGPKANQHLRVIINSMDTSTLGIQPLPVNPRDAAVASLSAIDGAIDYSLNENTRMGAYQTELSYTITNLTTASENTQASESTIRDADMAKTMMEHAKYTILTQSTQSMLAQSNQNSSSVLSLLQ